MKETAKQVFGLSLSHSLNNESWEFYGFSKRPKYGSFFNKYLRPAWKVKFEKELTAEIVITVTAIQFVGGVINSHDISEIVDTIFSTPAVASIFEFTSKNELEEAILGYAALPISSWPEHHSKRLQLKELGDKDLKMAAGVLRGCQDLPFLAKMMIKQAKEGV